MNVECYSRWKGSNLICLCKVDNPACDKFKSCEVEIFTFDKFRDIEKCMNHEKYKRENGRLKQR